MLQSGTATDVLIQAVLPHPMLAARWRWNLNRALVVPRSRGGQRRPIHLQRMEAEDLLAASWPALAACQENAGPGPGARARPRPGAPDGDRLPDRAARRRGPGRPARGGGGRAGRRPPGGVGGGVAPGPRDPDRAAVHLPRRGPAGGATDPGRARAPGPGVLGPDGLPPGLPVAASELGPLDPVAAAEVLDQVRPRPRDRDELHDLLLSLVLCRPVPAWQHWFDDLDAEGRAGLVGGPWAATERRAMAEGVHRSLTDPMAGDDESLAECVGGHLDVAGPVSVDELVGEGPLPTGSVRGAPLTAARARTGLARLQAAGSAIAPARRPLVRPPPAGPAARGQPGSPPAPRRAGQHGRLRAVRRLLAARGRRDPGRGPVGAAGGHRTAPGPRGGGRRVGAHGASRPGGRLRPPVAGRAVPGRRGGLGPAVPPARGPCREEPRARRHDGSTAPELPGGADGARPPRPRPPRWPSSPVPTSPGCWPPCGPIGPCSSRRPGLRPTCWPPCGTGGPVPVRAGLGLRPAGRRDRRGTLGPGGPGHRDRRRLLGGAVPAVRPAAAVGVPAGLGPARGPRPPAGPGRERGR